MVARDVLAGLWRMRITLAGVAVMAYYGVTDGHWLWVAALAAVAAVLAGMAGITGSTLELAADTTQKAAHGMKRTVQHQRQVDQLSLQVAQVAADMLARMAATGDELAPVFADRLTTAFSAYDLTKEEL